MEINKLQPNEEVYKECIKKGIGVNASIIIANRLSDKSKIDVLLNPTSKDIYDYNTLENVKEAGKLIGDTILNNKKIVLVTDYDADGNTSASVLHYMLTKCFKYDSKNVFLVVNERRLGNGINSTLVTKILDMNEKIGLDLLISADHGSSDNDRFKIIKENAKNLKLCITDHHLVPEDDFPADADVFVNPQQHKDNIEHKCLSGCAVAYYTMLATMDYLKSKGKTDFDESIKDELMSIVAISTIADSMNMSDVSNRYIVKYGLKKLFLSKLPVWIGFNKINRVNVPMNDRDISFKIAPLINAASRMHKASYAARFLLSRFTDEVKVNYDKLMTLNKRRKDKQAVLINYAKDQVKINYEKYPNSNIVVLNNAGGINGVIASMLTFQYKKPAIVFTDNNNGKSIAGSGRSVNGDILSIRDCYEYIASKDKDIIIAMGGHKGAAGCTIYKDKYHRFKELFEEAVLVQMPNGFADAKTDIDNTLKPDEITFDLLKDIDLCRPYGVGWKLPIYSSKVRISKMYFFGKNREHVKFVFEDNGYKLNGVYINGNDGNYLNNIEVGDVIDIVFHPERDSYKIGNISLNIDDIIK